MSVDLQKHLSQILLELEQIRGQIYPEIQKELARGGLFKDKAAAVQAAALYGQLLAHQGMLLLATQDPQHSNCLSLCPYLLKPVIQQCKQSLVGQLSQEPRLSLADSPSEQARQPL